VYDTMNGSKQCSASGCVRHLCEAPVPLPEGLGATRGRLASCKAICLQPNTGAAAAVWVQRGASGSRLLVLPGLLPWRLLLIP
jgi:hypothetical protein